VTTGRVQLSPTPGHPPAGSKQEELAIQPPGVEQRHEGRWLAGIVCWLGQARLTGRRVLQHELALLATLCGGHTPGSLRASAGTVPSWSLADSAGFARAAVVLAARLGVSAHDNPRAVRTIRNRCAGFRASCFTPAQLPVQPEPHQLALLERALAALDDGASATRALLLSALSYALVASGQRTRREALGAESVAIARTLADPVLLTRVLQVRALTLCAPGARREQLAVCDELVALTSAHGDAATRVEALLRRAFAQLAGANFEAAERDALRAAQLAAWEPLRRASCPPRTVGVPARARRRAAGRSRATQRRAGQVCGGRRGAARRLPASQRRPRVLAARPG
jgi:hypothetical protein